MAAASIIELAKAQPAGRPAISGIGRMPMSYGELARLADQTVHDLNRIGIGREDRVAVILPNGPELAAVFVSIAAGASVAPLNPAFREDEFDAYLADLAVKAVVVEKQTSSIAATVARRRDIPVLELASDPQRPAGWFRLLDDRRRHGAALRGGMAQTSDEALVLHTSGTTSRPKIVPLTQHNLIRSANNVQAVLQLRPDDVGLNIMPLFHIHGLVASLLVSLVAGAAITCAPAFDPLKFYRWFAEARPSWYTGVPTMHQAILARAPHNQSAVRATRLRFIRSCSAALPSKIADDLERLFRCPVIEAYGMTEAAHQIACNPLPPMRRKIGTVGLPAGPEVCVLDERHGPAGPDQVGEIVIRGSNVFAGYANNHEANANSFVGGWFRTGDLGFVDRDGYLTVTARSKEIIIRGGEKIAPREIDEVLHAHPAVEQAIAFSLPHPTLGEDIAAVVVLKDGAHASENEIRSFVAERLAKFKVPRRILFRNEIPKSATGKPQRIILAQTLGLL
ncbi:MAG TPA: acyl--CoA ligase [Stellaceae bacterium]|nr:acyl--CoA ligase [Stellaceae bacterium]